MEFFFNVFEDVTLSPCGRDNKPKEVWLLMEARAGSSWTADRLIWIRDLYHSACAGELAL